VGLRRAYFPFPARRARGLVPVPLTGALTCDETAARTLTAHTLHLACHFALPRPRRRQDAQQFAGLRFAGATAPDVRGSINATHAFRHFKFKPCGATRASHHTSPPALAFYPPTRFPPPPAHIPSPRLPITNCLFLHRGDSTVGRRLFLYRFDVIHARRATATPLFANSGRTSCSCFPLHAN